MEFDYAHWSEHLTEMCRRHEIPGATFAVGSGDRVVDIAVGVRDLATGAPMTGDAMFPIGSITKVYTATLVMRLVDAGMLDLDTRVRDILPGFRVADPDTTAHLTVRHLLGHSSGLENGVFPDVGEDDDCLERYAATCTDLGQLHKLGALGAYSQVGYVIAGRVVERVTGLVWDDAVRTHLLEPLGLRHTASRPDDVPDDRRVPGHRERTPGAGQTPVRWDTPRLMGPGSAFFATAADVVRFGAMHASGGGTALTPQSAQAMLEPHVPLPCGWAQGHRGLGWRVYPRADALEYGHGGELPGLLTYLHVLGDPGVAVALCSNGGDGMALRDDVRVALAAQAGTTAQTFTPPDRPADVDLTPFLGTYRCPPSEATLERDDTGLWLRPRFHGGAGTFLPRPTRLVPMTETLLAGYESDGAYPIPVTLHTLDDGSRYLYARERMMRRIP